MSLQGKALASSRGSASTGTRGIFPPWAWHEHANEGDEPAVLFSIQDTPVFEALGLYREEAYADNRGHQLVTSVFEG
jgi:gentisate 1,2-dioxygenase